MERGSIYHTLSCQSHCAKRTSRQIGAAEILAADESIDEYKILAKTLFDIYIIYVLLTDALDSKDLFTSLSTQ